MKIIKYEKISDKAIVPFLIFYITVKWHDAFVLQ
jgi:hypothetical protein